jgi:hypothetical protein
MIQGNKKLETRHARGQQGRDESDHLEGYGKFSGLSSKLATDANHCIRFHIDVNRCPLELSQSEIINKALVSKGNFSSLWYGDTSSYGNDHSAADCALCLLLRWWFTGNPSEMDSAFRQSGLMRDKWDEKHSSEGETYGQMTISKALEGWSGESYGSKSQNLERSSGSTANGGTASLEAKPARTVNSAIYRTKNGRIYHEKPSRDGTIEVPLCNFVASISRAVTRDDGAESSSAFALEGVLHDGTRLPSVEVNTSEFAALNWAIKHWGAYGAIVYAGQAVKDHLRAAIQELSSGMERINVFCHTGWRPVKDQWIYLSAGSVIGKDGPLEGVSVELSEKMKGYALPTLSKMPSKPTDTLESPQTFLSLELLTVAPDHVSIPLFAHLYRSPISPTRYSVHLFGLSGSAKSGLAAIPLQHFKPSADRYNLTAEWKDTDNTLERILFEAKDALVVFDDFNPTGAGPQDANKWHSKAERVFRAQGNGSGRSRMRADLTLRPPMPPRGSLLSTGEELPKGYSLQARVFTVSLAKGDVDIEKLKSLTQWGKQGVLAQCMSTYIQWLAPQLERIKTEIETLAEGYQSLFKQEFEPRVKTPTETEHCMIGT